MKRKFAVTLALALSIMAGSQIVADSYEVMPAAEWCIDNPSGGGHYWNDTGEDIEYTDYCDYFHFRVVDVCKKCTYCGKLGEVIETYHDTEDHHFVSSSYTDKDGNTHYTISCAECGHIYD